MYDTKLTAEQKRTLKALTQEWNAKCEGDYESTFVGGVAHAYCDSGIMTDGLSGADVEMLSKYFTGETIYSAAVDIETMEHWVTLMEEDKWRTDLYKFVDAVNSVLTDEQHKNMDSTEAAMSYCWECCE